MLKTMLSAYALYKGVKFAKAAVSTAAANAPAVLGVCAAGMIVEHYAGQINWTPNENWVKFNEAGQINWTWTPNENWVKFSEGPRQTF